jgi:four helix bundle protein
MHRFKELTAWQKAVDLALDVYQVTKRFPSEERFGLISQINRCGVSMPSNIAEGAGRNTDGEFHHFLGISVGSSCELETQLIIANRLNFLAQNDLVVLSNKIADIQNMTFGLQKSLKS